MNKTNTLKAISTFSALAVLPIAGVTLSASSSMAQVITGDSGSVLGISSFNPNPPFDAFVTIEILNAVTGGAALNPLACGASISCVGTFTFNPVFPPNTNHLVDFESGTAFDGFVGTTVGVKPFSLPFPITSGTLVPPNEGTIPGFLTLANNNFFNLEQVSQATFNQSLAGTDASFDAFGTFVNTNGETFDGFGLLSATFAGLTTNEVLFQAAQVGGISTPDSGTFVLEVEDVPEPSTVTGLALLGGSALFLRKRRKAQ